MAASRFRFGFEGVTEAYGKVVLAFQRAWQEAADPADKARIGVFDPKTREWRFGYYPLVTPTLENGGRVGLSEITHIGDGTFAVVERDNQGGPDATIKKIYAFSGADVTPLVNSFAGSFPTVEKFEVRDLLPDLKAASNGPIVEKVEGFAIDRRGNAYVINDNYGVDDNSGETQLIRFKRLFGQCW